MSAEMECASCGSDDGIYSEDGQWTCNECGDEWWIEEEDDG